MSPFQRYLAEEIAADQTAAAQAYRRVLDWFGR
jgi:hypothetical protein